MSSDLVGKKCASKGCTSTVFDSRLCLECRTKTSTDKPVETK